VAFGGVGATAGYRAAPRIRGLETLALRSIVAARAETVTGLAVRGRWRRVAGIRHWNAGIWHRRAWIRRGSGRSRRSGGARRSGRSRRSRQIARIRRGSTGVRWRWRRAVAAHAHDAALFIGAESLRSAEDWNEHAFRGRLFHRRLAWCRPARARTEAKRRSRENGNSKNRSLHSGTSPGGKIARFRECPCGR